MFSSVLTVILSLWGWFLFSSTSPAYRQKFWIIAHTEVRLFNILRPRQNGHNFTDNNFKCIFFKISLKFLLKGQYSSIGSDNGLVLNRRKAIIWTNDVLGCRNMYASPGHNELKTNFYSVCPCKSSTKFQCIFILSSWYFYAFRASQNKNSCTAPLPRSKL